jgi:hypothetical protein
MGQRSKHDTGPQDHAEGQHGGRTHQRFVEQLQESERTAAEPDNPEHGGARRLHQDREQHDEAEKNSEKVEAMREVKRGHVDDAVLSHARIPHEGDSR